MFASSRRDAIFAILGGGDSGGSQMAKAKATNDPNLLKPFVFEGPAVERDHAVKDQNDAVRADETAWLKRALAQNDQASESEVGFFATLRGRMKDAK